MTRRPGLTGKRLVTILSKAGFDVIRVKGSHHFLRHADDRATVVPVHAVKPSAAACYHGCLAIVS